LSLVTRLVGFGLCLIGAFTAAYFQSLHSTAGVVGSVISKYVSTMPDYNAALLANVATFVQQNLPSAWGSYVDVGIAMAIFGSALVAIGDRRPTGAKK